MLQNFQGHKNYREVVVALHEKYQHLNHHDESIFSIEKAEKLD